ncbi:hypothetical protein PVAP13_8KG391550 [Panicum virgatum]|uniref:Uncharacterized protein n=1 Tax=Panicum virgatum TaxID=38727 RepID=A0A8T0PUT2_PANVG|nr:hypothetical protein PVAP13_8KG391550 [Panicum virgatum]
MWQNVLTLGLISHHGCDDNFRYVHLESFGLSILLRTCHVRILLRMREFTTHRTTDRHNVNLRTLRRYVHLESFGPSILL